MTSTERILVALRQRGPLTDTQLREMTGVEPHQQVNQICRRLEAEGVLRRSVGSSGRIVNTLTGSEDVVSQAPSRARPTPDLRLHSRSATHTARATSTAPVRPDRSLLLIPCSGRKIPGGRTDLRGRSVLDLLPDNLAERLRHARAALQSQARVNESALRPAVERYAGTLYVEIGDVVQRAADGGSPVVIISGGYGLLVADEPIGFYDRTFSIADWPRGLLEECLVALSQLPGVDRVLAFCAQTTSYADLLRRVPWRRAGVEALLVSPSMEGRRGAQVLVPRAAGQAFIAAIEGHLAAGWRSSDDVGVRMESLL